MLNKDHFFLHLFWFCVGVFVVSFISMMALIFVHFPDENREMAANTQGFLQGSLIMSVVGFLLTGNIVSSQNNKNLKTTTEQTVDGTKVTTEPTNSVETIIPASQPLNEEKEV